MKLLAIRNPFIIARYKNVGGEMKRRMSHSPKRKDEGFFVSHAAQAQRLGCLANIHRHF
jgi:hypothetical protein